jgi:hypothetical protein
METVRIIMVIFRKEVGLMPHNKKMTEKEKITIIEGPAPTFELVNDNWVNGIIESPTIANIAVTQVRTFNGPALVERCFRSWKQKELINLEFKDPDGLVLEVPIIAARSTVSDEGQLLHLWVRLPESDMDIEFEFEDSEDDEFSDDDYEDFDDGNDIVDF